jgi:hypothetical protein
LARAHQFATFWHQPLEITLSPLVAGMGLPGLTKRGANSAQELEAFMSDHPDRFNPRLRWIAIERNGRFASLEPFSCNQDGPV